ncbi:MAG: DUF2799 domain-containing protein [Robiginitomaculum sp.]|nr:DUF2799 domain-containing protein [Robiginitomaculum sp.]
MLNKFLVGSILVIGVGMLLPACASISESECQAGNWADLGYRDGVNGKSRSRIADYVETCGEYGAGVDRSAYLSSYEAGLTYYCTYDKGFERGKDGSSYNAVCDGPMAVDFRAGYDAGYGEYELRQRYEKYEEDIADSEKELQDVKDRLADPPTESDEKTRLAKKKKRIMRELEDLRWDFRSFKRKYDLDW